ncbi:MAG TPA: guanylate kinase [Anaeromyxobacter sp.]|nr:guanylate kinase [Anaeromyxobacter sp.]
MSSDRAGGSLPGLLLVLSAPSGAGKTTLAHRFRETHPDAVFSVSATTRARRGAETDGADYHFLTPDRFEELVREGAFAEWAEVYGERYGTLRGTVEEALSTGRVALFDIDVQGGEHIKGGWPEATATVLVLPPSPAELERRLRGRSTDAEDVITKRLGAARAEVARGLASYDYVVVNDDVERALVCLDAIVTHERARRGGAPDPGASRTAAACRKSVAALAGWEG